MKWHCSPRWIRCCWARSGKSSGCNLRWYSWIGHTYKGNTNTKKFIKFILAMKINISIDNERRKLTKKWLTSYKEYCSTGSFELKHVNNRLSNSSDVVSSDINKLLYSDVGSNIVVWTRIKPPGFVCKQNLCQIKKSKSKTFNTICELIECPKMLSLISRLKWNEKINHHKQCWRYSIDDISNKNWYGINLPRITLWMTRL